MLNQKDEYVNEYVNKCIKDNSDQDKFCKNHYTELNLHDPMHIPAQNDYLINYIKKVDNSYITDLCKRTVKDGVHINTNIIKYCTRADFIYHILDKSGYIDALCNYIDFIKYNYDKYIDDTIYAVHNGTDSVSIKGPLFVIKDVKQMLIEGKYNDASAYIKYAHRIARTLDMKKTVNFDDMEEFSEADRTKVFIYNDILTVEFYIKNILIYIRRH